MKLKFLDPTDVSTLINKSTGKNIIANGLEVIPIYKGKKYSVKDVVNKDGTVNVRKAKLIMEDVAEYFGGKKMLNRAENPKYHKDDPNTWLHTKKVAKNAWNIPVPNGYTKQDQMIAALGHDFGKILSGEGHAEVSYNLIKLIFPDATEKLLNAIRKHMDPLEEIADLLELGTHFADLGVVPEADLSKLGLSLKELDVVNKTKWFKSGGNLVPKASSGRILDLFKKSFPKKAESAISKEVKNFLDLALEVDLIKNAFPSGFSPNKYQLLRLYRKTYLDAKFGNSDFVSTAEKLMKDVEHTFGNNKKAINYIYAPISEDVRKLFVKNEIDNLPKILSKMQRAALELNYSKEFDSISSQSIKHLNKDSDITIFPKPVTILLLKNDIYKRYAREFEDLTGIKLSKEEVMNLSEATDRFQDVARLEEEMNKLGSKKYTVYGAVSAHNGSDYDGFILGTTKINKDDPATKLMLEQIKNLRGSTISGEELNELENAVINSVPKNKTYLYSSDNSNSDIGGYFNPLTGLNFVNTRNNTSSTLRSTVIHEGLSHSTDSVIPDKIKKAYVDLVEVLNLQPNRRADESKNWEEMRATFNELKNKLAPDGKVSTLKKNVEKMDSDLLSWELSNVNAYGQDYSDALVLSPKEMADTLKKAIIVLPATALAVIFGMNNTSEEVPKAQEGIKFPELDYEEPIFTFRHLNNEYQAQDFDNELTDFYYRGQINNGELTDKARHKLLRDYNLNNIELKETLDDLHTAGLANVLNVNPSYEIFKEGGKMIPKALSGKALITGVDKLLSDTASKLKDIGVGAEEFDKILRKEIAEEVPETGLILTGTTKKCSKQVINYLDSLADKGDNRAKVLSEVMQQVDLPADFVAYVESGFKYAKNTNAPKTIRALVNNGKEPISETITWHNKQTTRVTGEKTSKSTAWTTLTTPQELNSFGYRKPKTEQEVLLLDEHLDKAVNYLSQLANGKFQLTDEMLDSIYLKSKGLTLKYPGLKLMDKLARKNFNFKEQASILESLIDKGHIITSGERTKFDDITDQSILTLKNLKLNIADKYDLDLSEIEIVPVIKKPKAKTHELNYNLNTDGKWEMKADQTVTYSDSKYVSDYAFEYVIQDKYGDYKIVLTKLPKKELHHALTALAEAESIAIMRDPANRNPLKMIKYILEANKGVTTETGYKLTPERVESYYRSHQLLDPESHREAHKIADISKANLGREKQLAASGRFQNIEDLRSYLLDLQERQKLMFAEAKQNRLNKEEAQWQRKREQALRNMKRLEKQGVLIRPANFKYFNE